VSPPLIISVEVSPQSSVLVFPAVSESVEVCEIVLREPKHVVKVGPAHDVRGQVFVDEDLFPMPP
jgi:hypothetical protein